MYLIQYVNAFMACEGLMEKEMDFKTAHAVMLLRHDLKKHADFFAAEEMKLVGEYAKKTEAGEIAWEEDGRFVFDRAEDAETFKKRRGELGMTEVEDFAPRKAGKIKEVRPAQLEALFGFLEFEGENNTSSTASGPPSPQGEGLRGGEGI